MTSRFYREILHNLRQLSSGATLEVDLRAMQEANYGLLKDIFAVLLLVRSERHVDRYLLFLIDESASELMEALDMMASDRREPVPALTTGRQWRLFGRLPLAERETLALVLEEETLTTARLCERLHLTSSAASNRLRRLYELRLVHRVERILPTGGGREYVYGSLFAPDALPSD